MRNEDGEHRGAFAPVMAIPLGSAVGLLVGVVLGTVIGNVPLGIGVGLAGGVCTGGVVYALFETRATGRGGD